MDACQLKFCSTKMLVAMHLGIMAKKMETTIVCWGYIGIMEKRMESARTYWGYIYSLQRGYFTANQHDWGVFRHSFSVDKRPKDPIRSVELRLSCVRNADVCGAAEPLHSQKKLSQGEPSIEA